MRSLTNWKSNLVLVLLVALLAGCDFIAKKPAAEEALPEEEIVARVYDKYLYKRDLAGIGASGDSAVRGEIFVKNWIRKQLMIAEAASNIDFDEAELERKILDYRYALMVHEYERYIVNKNLEDKVSEEEINQYYEENKEQFQLKQNIMKGIFAQVPKDVPRIKELRRLITRPEEQEELRTFCYQFAENYILDDSTWINLEDVIKNTPLAANTNKAEFLQKTDLSITSDDTYNYYLRVDDYKISEEISPLEFVKEDIVNIIINKRKIRLADQHREDIYNEAKRRKDFEIYE